MSDPCQLASPASVHRRLTQVQHLHFALALRACEGPKQTQQRLAAIRDSYRNGLPEKGSIDHDGLDDMDNRYLEALLHKFDGGPVGIKNLAIALGEEVGTLEEVYEPFLIQEGFVQRTPQGRIATGKAAERFGLTMARKPSDQPDLL